MTKTKLIAAFVVIVLSLVATGIFLARPPKPNSCDLEWGAAFSISEGNDVAERICHGDTVLGESADVLPYGSTWQQQGFTCLSEQSALTCFNAKRHGFKLSRAVQTLF